MAAIDSGTLVAIITAVGTVSVGAITGLFSWVVRRQSRTVDSAAIQKTRAETVAQEVKTARELLGDTRDYFERRLSDQSTEHREELAHITEQVIELKTEVQKLVAQQRAMATSFVAHSRWDHAAWARLLRDDPAYPPPPMIEGLL